MTQRCLTPLIQGTNTFGNITPSNTRPPSPQLMWSSSIPSEIFPHLPARLSHSNSLSSLRAHSLHSHSISQVYPNSTPSHIHLRNSSVAKSPAHCSSTGRRSPSLKSLGGASSPPNMSSKKASVDLTRQGYLIKLAHHPVLSLLSGHPGSISVITPLLLQYKLNEIEKHLVTTSIDDLVLSSVPEEQRFMMNSFTKSIQANLEYLYRTDKAAPAFFALFSLLPGGAFAEDLENIWPKQLALPDISHINSILNGNTVSADVVNEKRTSVSGWNFLVNLLNRMSCIVITQQNYPSLFSNHTSAKYSIFSFFTAVADRILLNHSTLRTTLTLRCYDHFALVAEKLYAKMATADGKDPSNPVYELFELYELNFWNSIQKWTTPVSHDIKVNDPGITSFGKIVAYFATLLFLVGGRVDDSRQVCELGMKGCQQLNDRFGENACLKLIGVLSYVQHNLDDAIRCFEQARINYKYMKCVLGQAITLNATAYIYSKKQNYQRAIKVYEESLALFKSLNHLNGQSNCLLCLATLVRKSNEKSKVEANTLAKVLYFLFLFFIKF